MTEAPRSSDTPGNPASAQSLPAGNGDILRWSLTDDGAGTTVSLAGELDVTTLPDAGMAVELASVRGIPITVNCAGLWFADAAALRFLRGARDRARSAGSDLVLANPQGIVRKALELTDSLALVATCGAAGDCVPVTLSRTAVFQAAVATAGYLAGTPRANLQLTDPAVRQLRIAAQRGFGRPFLEFFRVVDGAGSACGDALRTGTSVWVADVASSPIYSPAAVQVMLDAGAAACASVPVRKPGGELVAVISAHPDAPRAWPDVTRHQLERLATVTGRLM